MMYRVIEYFTDLQDDSYAYSVGDTFPRKGIKVSEDRLKELSSPNNKRGRALIEAVKVEKPAEPKAEEPAVEAEEQPKKKKNKRS